ncbi:MAG: hypothetical protein ACREOI_34430 [bacterium]
MPKREKVYPPRFAENTECRRKVFRRISVPSALLGERVFTFCTAWRGACGAICDKEFTGN